MLRPAPAECVDCDSLGDVAPREVAEDHRRSERATGAAVGHPERRGHRVTRRVQAGDHVAVDVEHARVGVGQRTALGSERAAEHLDRVVRRRLERAERGPRGPVAQSRIAPPLVLRAPAPLPVGIVVIARVGVEPLDGLLEHVAVDAELLAEALDRVRRGDPVRAGLLGPAEPAGEAVLVEPRLIEDQPARQVSVHAHDRVLLVERRAERVVVRRLVGEALGLPVDHDRAGQRPLVGEQLLAGGDDVGRQLDHRHPPRLAHVPEHRADPHRHLQAVTLVRLDRDRVRARPAQERPLELGVALEAAGRDHHVRRTHLLTPLGGLEHDARDLAVLHDQLDAAVLGLRLDAAVETGLEQPAAEREAHAALVVVGPALHLLRVERLRDRLAERGLADRQVVARVVRRDVDAVPPLAELAVGVDRRLQRPAALGEPAPLLGVVVREVGDGAELDRRALVEPAHHLGADVEVGLGHLVGDRVVRQRLEVFRGLLARVALLRRLVLVERDPDHPARVDGGPADRRALLEQADLGAQFGSGHRRGQASGSGAQHDDVVVGHALLSSSRNRTHFRLGKGSNDGGAMSISRRRAASAGIRRRHPDSIFELSSLRPVVRRSRKEGAGAMAAGPLEGKVAIVTGAAMGMGEATARVFAAAGAQVLVSDVNAEVGQATVERIERDGGSGLVLPDRRLPRGGRRGHGRRPRSSATGGSTARSTTPRSRPTPIRSPSSTRPSGTASSPST